LRTPHPGATSAIDMWAVGCIFAEMLRGSAQGAVQCPHSSTPQPHPRNCSSYRKLSYFCASGRIPKFEPPHGQACPSPKNNDRNNLQHYHPQPLSPLPYFLRRRVFTRFMRSMVPWLRRIPRGVQSGPNEPDRRHHRTRASLSRTLPGNWAFLGNLTSPLVFDVVAA